MRASISSTPDTRTAFGRKVRAFGSPRLYQTKALRKAITPFSAPSWAADSRRWRAITVLTSSIERACIRLTACGSARGSEPAGASPSV